MTTSSTSSSERQRVAPRGLLVCFLAGLVVAGAAGELLAHALPASRVVGATRFRRVDPPRAEDELAVYGEALDQRDLYYGFGGWLAQARRADVLIMGTSRVQLGISEEVLVPRFRAAGLRVFSIALGHAERSPFEMAVVRRHDLRPELVLVEGRRFFRDEPSAYGARVIADGPWRAWTEVVEGRAAWGVDRRVHALLPKLRGVEPFVIYRSRETGLWRPALHPSGSRPVPSARRRDRPSDAEIRVGRAVRDELRRRGARMVIVAVPSPEESAEGVEELARSLGVPCVGPEPEGLRTTDGLHLDEESARRFTLALCDELESLGVL